MSVEIVRLAVVLLTEVFKIEMLLRRVREERAQKDLNWVIRLQATTKVTEETVSIA